MTVPVWVLLGFAAWTLLTLFCSVGVYRWSHILTGRAQIKEFRADVAQGADWYQRAMRAHANCIENLPVYGAIVVALQASGIRSSAIDELAIVLLVARVGQTVTHIACTPSNIAAGVRFAFFFTQAASMVAMIAVIALHA